MGSIAAIRGERGQSHQERLTNGLRAAPHRGLDMSSISTGQVEIAISRRPGDTTVDVASAGEWAAAIHGRIDNAGELSSRLDPDSNSVLGGASLLIAAFRRWGTEALGELRGAFAGCVTDGRALWCFRDHLGSRPLFFRDHAGTFIVATEVKQVVAAAEISRQPNLEAIERLYYRGIGPDTAIQGVMRLSHRGLIEVDDRGYRQQAHWDPSEILETSRMDVDEAVESLRSMLTTIVPRHLSGADAIALSGGIDSSTVAAFAREQHGGQSDGLLAAYTATYPNHPSVDESRYTLEIADHLGIPLTTYQHTKSPLEDVSRWVDLADGPWESLPAAVVLEGYELARSLGADTVLTGELAEYVMTVHTGLLGHFLLRGRLGVLRKQLKMRHQGGRSTSSLLRELARDAIPAPLGKLYSRLSGKYSTFFPDWVRPEGAKHYRSDITSRARDKWAARQLVATRGTTAAIEANEIIADSVGVSVRRPLADRDLWEFFLALRAEVKFPDPQSKALIRRAGRGRVPDSVLNRTDKTVFDEHMLDTAPYDTLARLIDDSEYRMPRVDYELLRSRLAERALPPTHLVWAYDLARVHAFIGLFT